MKLHDTYKIFPYDSLNKNKWVLYKHRFFNTEKPKNNGIYKVKKSNGYNAIYDYSVFENGKFKRSEKYGLLDYDITHWKNKK